MPGLIQDTRPATYLFGDFPELSRGFTSTVYSGFRRPPRPDQIFLVEPCVNTVPDTTREEIGVKTFFGGLGPVMKPLLLEPEARLSVGIMADKMERLRRAKALLENADLLRMRDELKAADA